MSDTMKLPYVLHIDNSTCELSVLQQALLDAEKFNLRQATEMETVGISGWAQTYHARAQAARSLLSKLYGNK